MPNVVSLPDQGRAELLDAEEFLDWLEPGIFADLIGGQKIMHSPVSLRHANLVNLVDWLLRSFVDHRQIGSVHRETWALRLGGRDVFMPDVAYFTPQQTRRLNDTHAAFAPTLVVEALSPSSGKRDAGVKFTTYEAHGVQEYWLLDPDHGQHRFYTRDGEVFVEFAAGAARIESRAVHGFWMERAWLDRPTEVSLHDCFRQLVGES